MWWKTSRDRPKSAPYPRLKNSKKTSKCQVFSFTVPENRKFYEKKFEKITYSKKWTEWRAGARWRVPLARWKGDTSEIVNIFVAVEGVLSQNIKKLKGGFLFSEKNLTVPKKIERGDPLGFSNIHSVAKQQKNWRGDPLRKKYFPEKKSRSAEKNWKGGPFGLAGYGMLRGKTGKIFLVQFARPNSAIWCNNIL